VLLALATLALGALFGAINGALVAGLRLPSIVVTLATLVTWRESLRWITEGETVRNLPETFLWLGMGRPAGQAFIVISSLVLLALVLFMNLVAIIIRYQFRKRKKW